MEGLTNNISSSENVLNEADITRYIKSITLQLQITKFLAQNFKVAPNNLSVFGNSAQRSGTCCDLYKPHQNKSIGRANSCFA